MKKLLTSLTLIAALSGCGGTLEVKRAKDYENGKIQLNAPLCDDENSLVNYHFTRIGYILDCKNENELGPAEYSFSHAETGGHCLEGIEYTQHTSSGRSTRRKIDDNNCDGLIDDIELWEDAGSGIYEKKKQITNLNGLPLFETYVEGGFGRNLATVLWRQWRQDLERQDLEYQEQQRK